MRAVPVRLSVSAQAQRIKHLGRVRRSFGRALLSAKVGWAGDRELHRLDCPEYKQAERTRTAVPVGSLDRVFVALGDDYAEGLVAFPAMHDCLRAEIPAN